MKRNNVPLVLPAWPIFDGRIDEETLRALNNEVRRRRKWKRWVRRAKTLLRRDRSYNETTK